APIRFDNPPKGAVFVDPQRLVKADPQTAGLVLEQRSDLHAWQSGARAKAGHRSITQMTEGAVATDPETAITSRQHGVDFRRAEPFDVRKTDDGLIAETVDPLTGHDPEIAFTVLTKCKHEVAR